MNKEEARQLVLDILADEVAGRVSDARKKMHPNYTMTWMYKNSKGKIFPSWKPSLDDDLNQIYAIKGRVYEIYNMAFSENKTSVTTVFVELVEKYPDPKNGKMYQTPLVLVLEIVDGKIKTGRHYCDNDISFENLNKGEIEAIFKDSNITPLVIENNSQ